MFNKIGDILQDVFFEIFNYYKLYALGGFVIFINFLCFFILPSEALFSFFQQEDALELWKLILSIFAIIVDILYVGYFIYSRNKKIEYYN